MNARLSLLWLPLLLTPLACAAVDETDDVPLDTQQSLSKGCRAYALALVNAGIRCPLDFDDIYAEDELVDRMARTCAALLEAPGSGANNDNLGACAAAMDTASCLELHGGLAACQAPFLGTRPAGEKCIFDSQCASGACSDFESGSSCGRCLPPAGPGERCGIEANDRTCEPGLVCLASTSTAGTCEPVELSVAEPGSPCSYSCNNPWLACHEERCTPLDELPTGPYSCRVGQYYSVDSDRCKAIEVGSIGAECDGRGKRCDLGLYCDDTSLSCRSRVKEGGQCERNVQCGQGMNCMQNTYTVPTIDDYSCYAARPSHDAGSGYGDAGGGYRDASNGAYDASY